MITEVFIAVDRDEVYRATLPPGEYLIGRDPEAQIRIDHPTISRHHARLIVDEDQLVLTDLDSGNGTMIEEVPVVGARHFYEGETARLGDVLLRARQNVTVDALPQSISHYRKGEIVGAGGMGAIHEARQSAMGRKVAMKVMLREQSGSGLRRFINEARITGMLEHPNIVPVHELGVDGDGRAFYTMKFVHGTTLAEVLAGVRTAHPEAVKKYPLPFLVTVFQKVCDAIAFAHSRGVHHRDLKPENVMIGDFGEVLVMDWGLSKETGFVGETEEILPGTTNSDGAEWRTMEGSVLGTPAYMSPEQARGEIEAVDERSDIYCLGAILHEILYLQPPVSGCSALEIVDKVGRGEVDALPEKVRPHWPGGRVPASLEAVRGKAMAFDAALRYQNVTELQSDIVAYQSGFATSAEAASVATQALLFFKRNRGVSLSVLGGLVLLAALSSLFIWSLQHQLAEKEVLLGERDAALRGKDDALVLAEKKTQEAQEKSRESDENRKLAEERLASFQKEQERANSLDAEKNSIQTRAESDRESAAKRSFNDAQEALRTGNFDKAMRDINLAIERDPAEAAYLLLRADLLQSSGQLALAVEAYRNAIERGAVGNAQTNLALSEKFVADPSPSAGVSEKAHRELSKALVNQGRNQELPFLDAAWKAVGGTMKETLPSQVTGAVMPSSLKELPGWADERFTVRPDGKVVLNLSGLDINSLENLRMLNLGSLDLRGTKVTDLSPLLGMQIEEFYAAPGTSDLRPLQTGAESLRLVDLRGSQVTDLAPLAGAVNLEELWLDGLLVNDLEPLRGKPLKRLFIDLAGIKDFGVIGSLSKLEELALPRHASGVPVAGLEALKKVRHPRFQSSGEIDGSKFKELSAKSDEAWRKWGRALVKLGGPALGPDRLTVVEEVWTGPRSFPDSFDLDLRGLEISNLRLLGNIPLNRIYIDTKDKPVDLKPLAGNKMLKHLVLTGANVPSLQGVLDRTAPYSIVLSASMADVHRLNNHPAVERAGYDLDLDTRMPTTTVKELFAGRDPKEALPQHPRPGRQTEVTYLFDDAGMQGGTEEVSRLELLPSADGKVAIAVWRPDPPLEGGAGGGYLEFSERVEDGETSYFKLPSEFRRKKQALYGYSLGFELGAGGDGELRMDRSDVVVRSDTNSLHFSFLGQNPARDWRKYFVALREGEGWTVGSPGGKQATEEDFKSVLSDVSGIEIRTEFHDGGTYEWTRIDNVALWDVEETAARVWDAKRVEQEKSKWISVESGKVDDWMGRMGLRQAFDYDKSRSRASEYKGRYGPLVLCPMSASTPARVIVKPETRTEPGTLIRFGVRGAQGGSGLSVKVVQNGVVLQEWSVGGDRWSEFSAVLPAGSSGKGETLCAVEVWHKGDIDPYCFISGLELVPASKLR